ncbi:hypothetical protein V5799_005735 [Amblyomma americanum]|uniref:Uncharacterized protein n=1 Tax=Amblyomma americanum TaxID=6943 RepID=A0AAQ4DYD6_AMBAM
MLCGQLWQRYSTVGVTLHRFPLGFHREGVEVSELPPSVAPTPRYRGSNGGTLVPLGDRWVSGGKESNPRPPAARDGVQPTTPPLR